MRGATHVRRAGGEARRISIHAPHAGCDRLCRSPAARKLNFNPRTPCGVRPRLDRQGQTEPVFQSTHPMRGATQGHRRLRGRHAISIHAPHAGCDPIIEGVPDEQDLISIHAPHAGCDSSPTAGWRSATYFNPRTPCGVRQAGYKILMHVHDISIHAPHAGCDDPPTQRASGTCRFQSTHPMRGATIPLRNVSDVFKNFNPRTPCGVRPTRSTYQNRQAGISIHAPHAGCDSP